MSDTLPTLRLVVADDQDLVREGLVVLLGSQPDFEIVAQAADGAQALTAIRRTTPDVAVMDIRMPAIDGIEATRRIVAERLPTKVLVLTTYQDHDLVLRALRVGASGYQLKHATPDAVAAAIRSVAAGDASLAPAVLRRFIELSNDQRAEVPLASRLTPREREVWHLVAAGLSNSEIATRLFISEGTVKTHITRLFDKLEARDRVGLVLLARRQPAGEYQA